jgi:cellulose synthase/poly-beta-1,6-N-acetylglucosamine synthase-like glycosyltransferase
MAADKVRAVGMRRQLGSDRRQPLPAVAVHPGDGPVSAGRLAIVITLVSWVCFVVVTVDKDILHGPGRSPRFELEAFGYLVLITLLTASALAYLVTRLGYFHRVGAHRRTPRVAIDELFERVMPTMTVTVPSYQEDSRVVRRTLLSAALQEYPCLRIVLLIDDPPHPADAASREMLEAARSLPDDVALLLAEPAAGLSAALDKLESRLGSGEEPGHELVEELAGHHDYAVTWLCALADSQEVVDHADAFFADHVVRALARDVARRGAALRAAVEHGAEIDAERLVQLSRRLAWTFRAELSSFERKRYASLSHAPNKATNLNSYIGLMGGSYQEIVSPLGTELVPATSGKVDLSIPDPDYVLNLDADSVLLPEYCERIVYLLEQQQHERVAVGQTPYSAYPGAPTRVERVAGATTDVQHILHQGLTYYDATFWVGANAIVRKRALDEIMTVEHRGELEVRTYISDRTVIEDTDASMDLGIAGWSLLNYPERLSYSSTPPDFGALCVQRRRWANGGLLIMRKLRSQAHARRSRGERMRFSEWFLRLNYMASISWSSLGLVLMLAYPFNNRLLSFFTVGAAMPYFLMMATDLERCGYKRLDVLRIYAFNLALLPVNMAGTLSSIWQWLTSEQAAFGRTPKIRDRTRTPAVIVVACYAVVALSALTFLGAYRDGRWGNAIYAGLNTVLGTYALGSFIGFGASVADIWAGFVKHLYKHEVVPEGAGWADEPLDGGVGVGAGLDWRSVLYVGDSQAVHVPLPGAGAAHRPGRRTMSRAGGRQPIGFPPPLAVDGAAEP